MAESGGAQSRPPSSGYSPAEVAPLTTTTTGGAPPEAQPLKHLSNIEATAAKVSLYRSRAAGVLLRPDGLPYYDNSYDNAIVDAALNPEQQAEIGSQSHMLPFMVLRTAEIDRYIMEAVDPAPPPDADAASDQAGASAVSTAIRQVVLLGAGLDARAWRLPFPVQTPTGGDAAAAQELRSEAGGPADEAAGMAASGAAAKEESPGGVQQLQELPELQAEVVVFELDSGSVEEFKSRVLGRPQRCRRVFLLVDLEAPEQALAALAASGHDAGRPTVYVAEGLIGYLTATAGNALLAGLRVRAAPGSRLLLTTPPTPAWRDELLQQGMKLHHVTYEQPTDTLRRATDAGWHARLLTAAELGAKYGLADNKFELVVGSC